MAAPTFRTGAEKYAWLNRVQAVGTMVQLSFDPANRFIKCDFLLFAEVSNRPQIHCGWERSNVPGRDR